MSIASHKKQISANPKKPGNGETVNANRWIANKSFEVTDISLLRMIVDLGNLDNLIYGKFHSDRLKLYYIIVF